MAGSSSTGRKKNEKKSKRDRPNSQPSNPSKRPRSNSPSPPLPLPLPRSVYPFHLPSRDSGVTAQRAFQWLLGSSPLPTFLQTTFEKVPALIRAASPTRFSCLLSVPAVRALVCNPSEPLAYGADVDVTRYTEGGGRVTHNKPGEKAGAEAWAMFEDEACSIRLLRPQQHVDSLWAICSLLETFFGCVVGANAYLTPPNSQGFAPHYDDIDAFICQVSGRKRWRVYAPRGDGCDALPRRSSVDFSAEDMEAVEVVYDTVLNPGDLLYLPRGTVHQADVGSGDTAPSLHVTLSACQQVTWADFMTETLNLAVQSASVDCLPLRRSLPRRFTDYVGVGNADENKARRDAFDATLRKSMRLVANAYPIDAAADLHAERFMGQRLPPWEAVVASRQLGARKFAGKLGGGSRICAAGRGVTRVVMNEDGQLPSVVHCFANSRAAGEAGEEECGRMSCTGEEALAIDGVLKSYPEPVLVRDIGLDAKRDNLDLALILLEMGIAVRIS